MPLLHPQPWSWCRGEAPHSQSHLHELRTFPGCSPPDTTPRSLNCKQLFWRGFPSFLQPHSMNSNHNSLLSIYKRGAEATTAPCCPPSHALPLCHGALHLHCPSRAPSCAGKGISQSSFLWIHTREVFFPLVHKRMFSF